MKSLALAVVLVTVVSIAQFPAAVNADWWDDFTSDIHEKIVEGADFIRDRASPVIREKFNDAKQTLQDPETHEKVRSWVREKAVPFVEDKFERFKNFVNEEVMPEVQRIYEANAEAARREKEREKASGTITGDTRRRRR